jgi:hypothetical protein
MRKNYRKKKAKVQQLLLIKNLQHSPEGILRKMRKFSYYELRLSPLISKEEKKEKATR